MLIFDRSLQAELFRIDGSSEGSRAYLYLRKYYGVRETNKGYWVLEKEDMSLLYSVERETRNKQLSAKEQWDLLKQLAGKRLRFVLKNNTSKLCRTTFESALTSFKARKYRQIAICERQLESARMQQQASLSLLQEHIDKLSLIGTVEIRIAAMWEPRFDEEDDDLTV